MTYTPSPITIFLATGPYPRTTWPTCYRYPFRMPAEVPAESQADNQAIDLLNARAKAAHKKDRSARKAAGVARRAARVPTIKTKKKRRHQVGSLSVAVKDFER